ncbi:MAG: hypothetical protein ABSA85_18140, partial [Terracidiphilus sp.]
CLRASLEQAAMAACFALVVIVAIGTAGFFVYQMRHSPLRGRDSAVPGARLTPVAQTESQAPVLDWRNILRNDDIVELSRSGLASEVISKLINKSPHEFDVDAKSLASLKRSGVKDEVIAVIIDVTLSAPPAAAPAPARAPAVRPPAENPAAVTRADLPGTRPAPAAVGAPSPSAIAKLAHAGAAVVVRGTN